MTNLNLEADVINVRDIIERIEELENSNVREDVEQAAQLLAIMKDLAGLCGEEQWRGDWYPLMLIHERYFTDYCQELVKDCADLPENLPWYIAIDWDKTAENMKVDYTTVEINNETYYTR